MIASKLTSKVQTTIVADDPFRIFEEWRSEADARAYADL